MSNDIEFFFDFSSPYGYLAAQEIDKIGEKHGRTVVWKPFLLGITFKETGIPPLVKVPLKGDYSRHDLDRSARRLGVPFVWPDPFPFPSVAACRAFYWVEREKGVEAAKALSLALYFQAFGAGRDIATAEPVIQIAEGLGHEGAAEGIEDLEIKAKLKAVTSDAIERGVFGSPFFFVDGEPFWGHDRISYIDEWLEKGGW
jgi:2-hydroxychromene-2-carboxylate isomerase